jgi:membrane-bound metal-dependent hydrolase YbcI (DUF457 family)
MPLPVAHGLVGATVVALVHAPAALRRGWPLLIGAALAVCPDLDYLVKAHRTFTHSLVFGLAATAVLMAFGGRAGARAGLAYGLALTSHGLLDFAATEHGRGVMLLWPLSDAWFRLGVFSFSEFAGGRFPLARVLERGLVEAVTFTPVLLAVVLLPLRSRTVGAGRAARGRVTFSAED